MNKDKEIGILIATAAALGPDSYTGTWLTDQIPLIIDTITGDLDPTGRVFTLVEYRAEAARIIAQAQDEAARIKADAEERAALADQKSGEVIARYDRIKRTIDDARADFEHAVNKAYNQ